MELTASDTFNGLFDGKTKPQIKKSIHTHRGALTKIFRYIDTACNAVTVLPTAKGGREIEILRAKMEEKIEEIEAGIRHPHRDATRRGKKITREEIRNLGGGNPDARENTACTGQMPKRGHGEPDTPGRGQQGTTGQDKGESETRQAKIRLLTDGI